MSLRRITLPRIGRHALQLDLGRAGRPDVPMTASCTCHIRRRSTATMPGYGDNRLHRFSTAVTVRGVQDEPAELSCDLVAGWLRRHWAVAPVEVSYAPVGFGGYQGRR
jgi:hypothetical protein